MHAATPLLGSQAFVGTVGAWRETAHIQVWPAKPTPNHIVSTCAYCGSPGPLTKEHIWPKSLIEKYESLKTFNPRKGTFHGGEPVVKDVCATCNNIGLSPLDNYLSGLFDRHFARILEPGESAPLEYDYALLLRALLKISYNSSRSVEADLTRRTLARYANYILVGGHPTQVVVRLQVVTSSRAMAPETGEVRPFRPEALRVGTLAYDGRFANRFMVRLVGFNSYWFYVAIAHDVEPPHKWRDFLAALSNWRSPTGVRLDPQASNIVVPPRLSTYFHPALLGSLAGAARA